MHVDGKVVLVPEIAEEFVAAFKAKAESMAVGKPEEQVHIASVVDIDTIHHVAALIDDAVSKGATLVTGGAPESGTIMPPTIVDGVTPEMDIYAAESFGPVTTVIRAKDTEDAVRIANDTEYGLTAAVHGRNTRRAFDIARQLKTGIAHVNGPTVADEAQMPFGGMKASGYGRFGGTAGIDAFTELRWITIEDADQHYPI